MRLAEKLNETTAKQVLESIREIFSNSPFQFVVSRQVNNILSNTSQNDITLDC